jgi:hypothetical protein
VTDDAAIPEGDDMATTTSTKPVKKAAAKKAAPARKSTVKKAAAKAAPDLDMMTDLLVQIHDKAKEIDDARGQLDTLISESDTLIRDAVDEGERYRDIANAAGRTVPWVQMSLRRAAGVSTHPAAPIPDARIRRRKAS